MSRKETAEKMLQLYELCRLCAQKKRQKLDLFTSLCDEEAKILLSKISLCLSLHVTREDLLPKMICFDCQRAVEQFSAFKIKCQKAEERLNKMLSVVPSNKLNVTRIKQEYSEPDFDDTEIAQMKTDLPVLNDTLQFVNLNSGMNVKSELDDIDNESNCKLVNEGEQSELIKIISEEMISQQGLDKIKQPHIEIISENFNKEHKNFTLNEYNQFYTCDIKIIPKTFVRVDEDLNVSDYDVNDQSKRENLAVITESVSGTKNINPLIILNEQGKELVNSAVKLQLNEKDIEEIDEKYLTFKDSEACNDNDVEETGALNNKRSDPNSVFICEKCNRSFKFFKCFQKHKQWHNSQPEVFICDFCKSKNIPSFEFSSLKSLNNHILRKHLPPNSNKFACNLCHRILPSQGQLNAHYKKVHDQSGAACQTCGKKFKNQTCLNSHLRVHQNDRPYICDLCGQSFKWNNALKVHIMWHKQEKNFLCSECGKKFTAKKNLIEHLNIHSGKRPYTCETCSASFTQFSAFSKHLYLHNANSRIHKCDKCHLTFSHAYMLKQHLIRHTNYRPFQCSTCNSSFKSQSDLCCHSKIHQEKQYCCNVCGKKFAVSKTLRDHMVRHTGVKHKCPVPSCGKTYTQRFSLTKHFSKQHTSFSIVRKKSGKKSHMMQGSQGKHSPEPNFIRYDYKEKESEKD